MARFLVLIGLLLGTALVLGCGGDDSDSEGSVSPTPAAEADVTVNLTNWAIDPSADTLQAGQVTFAAVHVADAHGGHGASEGGATHQLIVAPLAEGKEPGKAEFGSPVLNLSDIGMGESKTGLATLEPGTYELACLVAEQVDGQTVNHYEKGMFTTIIVE